MATSSLTLQIRPIPATPRALVQSVGTGFMPVIHHPERPEYLHFEVFPRKTKLTPEAALQHAERVLWYRQIKKAALQRRHELLESPYSFLQAAE